MAIPTKKISELTVLSSVQATDKVPIGRPSSSSGNSITLATLAAFVENITKSNAASSSNDSPSPNALATMAAVIEKKTVTIDTWPEKPDKAVTYLAATGTYEAIGDNGEDIEVPTGCQATLNWDAETDCWLMGTPIPVGTTGSGGGGNIDLAQTLDPEATDEVPSSKAVAEYVAATVEGTYVDTEIDESNPSQDKMPTCEAVVEYVTSAIEDTYVTTDAASVQTSIPKSPDDTHVPSSKAVDDFVSARMGVKEPIIGQNILDSYNAKEFISGSQINISANYIGQEFSYSSVSGYKITGRILVIGGAVYYFRGFNLYTIAIFDSDDKLIKVLTGSAMTSIINHVEVMPANAAWIRCHYATKATNGVMVTFGEYKYSSKYDMDVGGTAKDVLDEGFTAKYRQAIPTSQLNIELIREKLTADHQYDYWKGKKIFVDGDSISDYIGNQPFWQQHVANNLRMEFITVDDIEKSYPTSDLSKFSIGNKGFGGTRLCPVIEEGHPAGTSQPTRLYSPIERCLVRRIAEGCYDNVNADLFIIFVGTNDWNHAEDVGAKLGTIDDAPFTPIEYIVNPNTMELSEKSEVWESMDERDKNGQINLGPYAGITFYGCLKYLVEWFIVHKPNADLVLLTPIKRDQNVGGTKHVESTRTHWYAKKTEIETENGTTTVTDVDFENLKLSDYAKAIKEVGELYGVPVCDLFSNCFMNPSTVIGNIKAENSEYDENTEGSQQYITIPGQDVKYPPSETAENIANGTQLTRYFDYYNGTNNKRDTTHPGPEGHKKIGRLVTGFLKSLC